MKGGPDRGQGRKAIPGARDRHIIATDEEMIAIKKLLQEMRKPSK